MQGVAQKSSSGEAADAGGSGVQIQGRSCQEAVGFLPRQFRRGEGVCKVLRLGDGWEREEGSSAFPRLVLQLDLDVHEVCSVLVSPQLTGGMTESQEMRHKPSGPPHLNMRG